MRKYIPVQLEELDLNAWQTIGQDWMVVAAGGKKHNNAMTVSWGSFGVLWNKPVATVYLRPQRYTRGFIDKKGKFSINLFQPSDEIKESLTYIGSVSGRDEDKLAKANLSISVLDKVPVIDQAKLVLECQVLYRSELEKDKFVADEIIKEVYPEKDFHYFYIGEITSAYQVIEVADDDPMFLPQEQEDLVENQ